jgi:hypothetical protein
MNEQSEMQCPSGSIQEPDRVAAIQGEIKALEQRVIALERAADVRGQTEGFFGPVYQRLSAAWNALLGRKESRADVAAVSVDKNSARGIPLNGILLAALLTILLVVILD